MYNPHHIYMQGKKMLFFPAVLFVAALLKNTASAQVSFGSEGLRESVYLSIGKGNATYHASTISIQQANASSFDIEQVNADNEAASKGGFPVNVRAGFFFDRDQKMALELSIDPVSYHVTDGQKVPMKGTLEHQHVDTMLNFSAKNGYSYYLNGTNFIFVSFVYRQKLLQSQTHNVRLDALGKVGIGPAMPHVMNTINGQAAESSFKLGGWDAGLELALRLTVARHVFLEAAYKYSHTSYTDIGIDNGSATQTLNTSQTVFSIGYWFSLTKHNPLFAKGEKKKTIYTIKPIHPAPINDM